MTENNSQTIYRAPTHPLAIVSLVLSILGLMPILPLVGSIAGIVTGRIARREIRSNPTLNSGDGIAQAGIILGWIGVGLVLLILAGFLMLVPASFSVHTSITPMVTVIP